MSSRSVQATLVIAFILALGAGVVVGMAAARHGGSVSASVRPGERSWLADELRLNPTQREQMQAIWSEVTQGPVRANGDRRRALTQERDEAITRLFTPEQKARYDLIRQEFAARTNELSRDREKLMAGAVERTKEILSDSQRQRYDELLKERGGRPRGRGFGPGRGPDSRPSTRPASHNG